MHLFISSGLHGGILATTAQKAFVPSQFLGVNRRSLGNVHIHACQRLHSNVQIRKSSITNLVGVIVVQISISIQKKPLPLPLLSRKNICLTVTITQ